LEAYDCRVENCKQGFSVYGGARSLVLEGCTILRCAKEGVLAQGSVENAMTQCEREIDRITPVRNSVTRAAEDWGRERRCALSIAISDCNISSNCSLGLSLDTGCQAEVRTTSFEWNDPYGILIKGSSSATIAACRFVYAGKSATSATSFWAQGYGGMAIKLAGVHVAINFGGDVQVVGCAFAGAEELAVEEEMAAPTHTKRKEIKEKNSIVKESGAYSKPVLKLDNKFDCILRKMPSLSQLAASLPRFVAQRASVAGVVLAGAQCRNSRTFQQESWSPTANQFYAIGNTHGFDVTAGLLLSGAADKVCVLLAACGDLRNLVTTAAACACPGRQLHFVCNDGSRCGGSSSKQLK